MIIQKMLRVIGSYLLLCDETKIEIALRNCFKNKFEEKKKKEKKMETTRRLRFVKKEKKKKRKN